MAWIWKDFVCKWRENPALVVFMLQISVLKVKTITVDCLCTFPVYRGILIAFLLLFIVTDQGLSEWDTLFQIRLSLLQNVCICMYIHVVWKRKILIIFWVKTIVKDNCIKLQFLCWIFFLPSILSPIRGQCYGYTAYWCWHIERKASVFNTSWMHSFHYVSYDFQEEEGWNRNHRKK